MAVVRHRFDCGCVRGATVGSVGIAVPRLSASMLGRATGKNHKVAVRCLIVIVYRLYLSIPETRNSFQTGGPYSIRPDPTSSNDWHSGTTLPSPKEAG